MSIETTLELLTPADLDALRMNKGQQTRQINQERRYLLLVITDSTFNTRVHYPLSLNEEIKVRFLVSHDQVKRDRSHTLYYVTKFVALNCLYCFKVVFRRNLI